jgi:hypothetical protein
MQKIKRYISDLSQSLRYSKIAHSYRILKTVALALLFGSFVATGTEFKGIGKVTYQGRLDKEERRLAEQKAVEAALQGWIVEVHPAHIKNFKKVEDELFSQLDEYVLNHVVLDTQQDKSTKKYSVAVRANLNAPLILEALLGPSGEVVGGDGELISYIFVARELIGKTSQSEEATSQIKAEEKTIGKRIGEDSASKYRSQERTAGIVKESTQFRDKALWDVTTAEQIDAAMGNVFTNANYYVIDAAILEEEANYLLSVNSFVEDYRYGTDITPETRRDAVKGLRSMEDPIRYFALGTLNVDEQLTNSVNGLVNVPVSVTGQVLDMKRRGAAVVKVGPVQIIGEGPTFITARNNALKKAGEKAAAEIVAQLSSKNIR